jgi:hypothetical protein
MPETRSGDFQPEIHFRNRMGWLVHLASAEQPRVESSYVAVAATTWVP